MYVLVLNLVQKWPPLGGGVTVDEVDDEEARMRFSSILSSVLLGHDLLGAKVDRYGYRLSRAMAMLLALGNREIDVMYICIVNADRLTQAHGYIDSSGRDLKRLSFCLMVCRPTPRVD